MCRPTTCINEKILFYIFLHANLKLARLYIKKRFGAVADLTDFRQFYVFGLIMANMAETDYYKC